MKRISLKLSKRQWMLLFSCFLCAILALGLHIISGVIKDKQLHEQVAERWDDEGNTAHVSVYFSESEKYQLRENLSGTVFQLESKYYGLLTELQASSITTEEGQNPNDRQVVYGYSATGTLTAETPLAKTDVRAYGVGGDFFLFHPLNMVKGAAFRESDLMQDKVILDTETAWKLFGSNDIIGMFIKIGGEPHMVVGVYERERGYLQDAAGNDKSCIFVSHDTLYRLGRYHGLETVEYLLPNPVTGFGKGLVEKQYTGMDVAFVEHQNRYEFMSLIGLLKAFGTRSMVLSGITFPYWENTARGIEDILVYLLLAELILLTYSTFVLCGILWWLWIHRQWRVAQLYTRVKDAVYDIRAKKYKEK